MKKNLLIIIGIIVLFIFFSVSYYNKLVSLQEQVKAAWAQVENQLQRRFDLIPNLVNTVKGYAAHEKDVLTAVTDARSRVGSAQTVKDKIDANRELTSALGRLLVVMENYPNLKADQTFLALQSQLEGTENRIAVERKRYNETAQIYNRTIRKIPYIFFSGLLGFDSKPYFEADAAAQKAPELKF